MLKTYHHPVETYMVVPEQLLWVNRYVAAAMDQARAQGKEPKNPKSRSRQVKTHKICCLAFASLYGLQDQFNELHAPLSLWTPNFDFLFRNRQVRIVAVAADESHTFGSTLNGKVWENDFSRGRCSAFILTSWFPPYVDIVGWLPREELATMKERSWYTIQEATVRPIGEFLGGGA